MGKFARKNQKELRQEAKRSSRKPRVKSGVAINVDEDAAAQVDVDSSEFMYSNADRYHQKKTKISERAFGGEDDDVSESEEEVLPVGGDTSEEDSDEDDQAEDDDDDLPNRAAWGNKRSSFYHTDFVDKDHGRFQGSDAEEAEEEEREAKELQAKLAKELTDDDFGLGEIMDALPSTSPADVEMDVFNKVERIDVSKLTDFEKRERIKHESPELLDLIADCTRKLTELTDVIYPLLTAVKSSPTAILTERALRYLQTKEQLILGYCQNITFYMALKAKRVSVENHPVTRRLVDFRRFLLKLDPLDKLYERPIATAMALLKGGGDLQMLVRKSDSGAKKRRVTYAGTSEISHQVGNDVSLSKRMKEAPPTKPKKMTSDSEDSDEEAGTGDHETQNKRKLTYQIAKNKGTTPYRKKEYRNPRVKHRMKYRKAQISRKGQVQTYRPEMKKYGGEITGIRAGIVRSIKFK